MPFDANLVLADGSADWSYANLVTNTYGQPVSTVRNDGGFAVLDMGSADIGSDSRGIAVVIVFTEAAAASDDELYIYIEESGVMAFSSDVHELGRLDIAAATKGVILGSEITSAGATIVRRIVMQERYLRLNASCNASGDDFGVVYAYLSPYPYKRL